MTTPFPFVSGAVLQASQLNDITNLPINDQTASYTLVVGDAGKRVIMNNAGATTITVNNSVFTTGDTIFIANKGAGTSTITAGAGVTINTSDSLALAQYQSGSLVALSASSFLFFPTAETVVSKVVQIVTGSTSTQATSSTTSYADTNLTATITPTSASNKVLVVVTQTGCVKTSGSADNGINLRLVRGSTTIQTVALSLGYTASTLSLYCGPIATQYLDSPATTSATTYKTTFANATSATGVRVQDASATESTIVLYEVTP